jgi:transposase
MNIPASSSHALYPHVNVLTDEQWRRIAPLLPEMRENGPKRGRPTNDIRRVVDSVMWVLRTRAPWSAMPDGYAPYQTAHRYYLRWKNSGVLAAVARALFGSEAILETRIVRNSQARRS